MYQLINHLHQKKFRSNRSIEKLHETNFRVIEIVIRCDSTYTDLRKDTQSITHARSSTPVQFIYSEMHSYTNT